MNWTPLNLTVRVGCHLAYEATVPTPVLFVLKPRLEGRVLVMQERLSFGIGLPAYEFQDSHGNITYRSKFMPGRNEVRHDALIALCRAFNLPARYVTGHLPDIDCLDHGSPMDFHAYCEVYLGQEWLTFDPRFNVPRIGRVKVAHGADAVDGAFATIYGEANLSHFEVWAYQVNPQQVSVGDPVDLSKRLDGTQTVRFR